MSEMLGWRHLSGVQNLSSRDEWVTGRLRTIAESREGQRLLDVGAGAGPYQSLCLEYGFKYESHDFNEYVPSSTYPGLHADTWPKGQHTYICDILDIPDRRIYDVVLCTEVLEHVPDPLSALRHMTSLLRTGGNLLVTVPLLSLMHQAPFWFQSGFSPFWFEHWSPRFGLRIEELIVSGDFVDLMAQENERLLRSGLGLRGIGRLMPSLLRPLRKTLPESVRSAGGFGTFFHASVIQG